MRRDEGGRPGRGPPGRHRQRARAGAAHLVFSSAALGAACVGPVATCAAGAAFATPATFFAAATTMAAAAGREKDEGAVPRGDAWPLVEQLIPVPHKLRAPAAANPVSRISVK